MLTHLNLCELAMKKSDAVSSRIDEELLMYDENAVGIDNSVQKTVLDIAHSKQDLEKSKTIKRNQMEYNLLASHIAKYPPVADTIKVLADKKDEVDTLKVNSMNN